MGERGRGHPEPARSAKPTWAAKRVVQCHRRSTSYQTSQTQEQSGQLDGGAVAKTESAAKEKIDGFDHREEKRTLEHQRKLKVSCLQDGKWTMLAYEEDGQKTDMNTPNFIL